MKVEIQNGHTVNVWDSAAELRARQDEGKSLAKLLAMDEQWTNRLIQLAQSLSTTHWNLLCKISKKKLMWIVEDMIKGGFPADTPYDESHFFFKKVFHD